MVVESVNLPTFAAMESERILCATRNTDFTIDAMKRFGVFNHGLRRMPSLGKLVGGEIVPVLFGSSSGLDATLGWGRRRFAARARRIAQEQGIPFLCIEDGFVRSVGLGCNEPPLSIVIDSLGIYYDATVPSQLETLIKKPLSSAQMGRAQSLISKWRSARISKYNHARELSADLHLAGSYVLVADQTAGDASIRYGLAGPDSFQRMLKAALKENPECTVLLKVHPEVVAGRKKGHFDLAAIAGEPRVSIVGDDVHPVGLIEHAQAVYVVTSQVGFEALLWGRPVRTFGMPFYAGWGLTEDDLSPPIRRTAVPLEQLAHAALIDYPRYIDPESGERCEVERVVEHIALQRSMRERFPKELYAVGFSTWKKPIVTDFFQGSKIKFVRHWKDVPVGASCIRWGRKPVPGLVSRDASLLNVEDGFIRSVGLGADLIRPLSWVVDSSGIYYDSTQPSDLERILTTVSFDDEIIKRASRLKDMMVGKGLTKYNVGRTRWRRPDISSPVILVPGQVESDASIHYGSPQIQTNMELLRRVRGENPNGYIVYKPHPDVQSGLRAAGEDEEKAATLADEVVSDAPMGDLLMQVDEVHLLTSLAGFEALIRGKRVVTYGQPFYAGWGLTTDTVPPARRTRKLTLDELVAGALILYPTYVSRTTGCYTTPERVLEELLFWRETALPTLSLWRRIARMVLRRVKG